MRGRPAPIGARDREVTIQQVTNGLDDAQMPVETWTWLCTQFMSKTDPSGRERYVAGQLSASAETRFEMVYIEDMDPEQIDVPKSRRLVYAGRTYDITFASMIGRREGIVLMALSRVG